MSLFTWLRAFMSRSPSDASTCEARRMKARRPRLSPFTTAEGLAKLRNARELYEKDLLTKPFLSSDAARRGRNSTAEALSDFLRKIQMLMIIISGDSTMVTGMNTRGPETSKRLPAEEAWK